MTPDEKAERERRVLDGIRSKSRVVGRHQTDLLTEMVEARSLGISYDRIGAAAGVAPQTVANRLSKEQS